MRRHKVSRVPTSKIEYMDCFNDANNAPNGNHMLRQKKVEMNTTEGRKRGCGPS